jgi:hypothetical protein
VRRADFGVCEAGALGGLLAVQTRERLLVVGEDRALVGELPEGAEFLAGDVEAERLVMGQELLEAAADLGGYEMSVWLLDLFTKGAFALGGRVRGLPAVAAEGRPAEVGMPETVRPIYVRSPDADVHITKMKDPWA